MTSPSPDSSPVPGAAIQEKPLLAALRRRPSGPPPIWLMRQAGRYLPEYRAVRAEAGSFLDLCDRPDLAAEVTLQPVRRFGLDAAIIFADILLVPRALGQALTVVEGEGPALDPIRRADDLTRLGFAGFDAVLAPVYDAIGRVARALPEPVALIGFAGAPWTVATYMVGGGGDQNPARLWAHRDPDGFARLIDLLTEATIRHLSAQIAAGAEVVQIFDTWAGVLPEAQFARWCIAPTRRIVDALRAQWPGCPIIGFPRGVGPLYRDYVARTGVDAVSVDTTLPAEWARAELQPDVVVQGNLDPLALWAGGAALRGEAEAILRTLGAGPHVFNLGHGVLQHTPPDHVAELVALVRGWRP
jgi:uroporphyrinogen decarboxylase